MSQSQLRETERQTVQPDQTPPAARQVREVQPRQTTSQVAGRASCHMSLPRVLTFDPNEDCKWVQELREHNDLLLLEVLEQQGKQAELEQQPVALTNQLRARTEQHAAAVAEVERAQDVIEALQACLSHQPRKEYKVGQYDIDMDLSNGLLLSRL